MAAVSLGASFRGLVSPLLPGVLDTTGAYLLNQSVKRSRVKTMSNMFSIISYLTSRVIADPGDSVHGTGIKLYNPDLTKDIQSGKIVLIPI